MFTFFIIILFKKSVLCKLFVDVELGWQKKLRMGLFGVKTC